MSGAPTTGVELTRAELDGVAAAMAAAGTTPAGPLTASLISGGRSNLTFRIDDGASAWILRTPPRAGRTPSAHDVAREVRVTAALTSTDVPVAPVIVVEEDESLLGGAFTVVGFVDGVAVRTRADLDALDDAALGAAVTDLSGTLAALHRVDHVGVGLERFGRPDAYAERQLRRWSGQWEHVGTPELDAEATALAAALAESLPRQLSTGIVHGDYRIDNTLLAGAGAQTHVAAVVDWELSTIGDPAADVAMMCAYRDEAFRLIVDDAAWTSDQLPSVDALAEGYLAAGGVELADWPQHLALACYKVAIIAAGIDHRRRAGGSSGAGGEGAGAAVPRYFELARAALARAR